MNAVGFLDLYLNCWDWRKCNPPVLDVPGRCELHARNSSAAIGGYQNAANLLVALGRHGGLPLPKTWVQSQFLLGLELISHENDWALSDNDPNQPHLRITGFPGKPGQSFCQHRLIA